MGGAVMMTNGVLKLNRVYMFVGGIGLMLMAIHVSLDAIGKYIFSIPIPATLEIVAYYYMPIVVALPLAFVEIKNGHVAVEMIHEMFPPLVRRISLVINGLISVSFLSVLTFLAGREAWRKFLIGEFMFGEYPIIIWPGRVIFVLGTAFFTIVVLIKTIGFLRYGRDLWAQTGSEGEKGYME
jgi:TRAP-type C4-dicarboxylate transport system permease small subunit